MMKKIILSTIVAITLIHCKNNNSDITEQQISTTNDTASVAVGSNEKNSEQVATDPFSSATISEEEGNKEVQSEIILCEWCGKEIQGSSYGIKGISHYIEILNDDERTSYTNYHQNCAYEKKAQDEYNNSH